MRLIILIGSALIIVPVILVIALKSALHHQSKQTLDQLIEQIKPVASLTYRELSTSLSGTLTLEDINLIPHQLGESLNAQAIKIHTPGLLFLLQGKPLFSGEAIPERLGISIEQMQPQISLGQFIGKTATQSLNNPILDCFYHPDDAVNRFGLDRLKWDITLGYQFDTTANTAMISSRIQIPSLLSFDMDIKLNEIKPSRSDLMQWALQQPGIPPITLRYQDSALEPLLASCAEKNQLSVSDTIDRLVAADSAHYLSIWGFYPGEALRQGFKDFLANPPHEIIIAINPSRKLDGKSLSLYKIQDVILLLQLTVSINANVVPDLTFTLPTDHPAVLPTLDWSQWRPPTDPANSPTTEATPPVVEAPPQPMIQPRYVPKYYPVNLAEADHYLGKKVKIYLTDQIAPREGWLNTIDKAQLTLERKLGTGSVVSEIPLQRIQKIEIFLKKPPQ